MKHMAFAATLALHAGRMPAASDFDGMAGATARTAPTNQQGWRCLPSREVVTTPAA
jgi:hypothetical protein